METTYWNNKGKFQTQSDLLDTLVPFEGECDANSPKLERYRQASNAYYDLYNNGGCNRGSDIRRIFGISIRRFMNKYSKQESLDAQAKVEAKMDKIVNDAFREFVDAPLKNEKTFNKPLTRQLQ